MSWNLRTILTAAGLWNEDKDAVMVELANDSIEVTGTVDMALDGLLLVAATLETDYITYTAVTPGADGNSITVEYVVEGNNTSSSVAVVGTAITVNLATDGDGEPIGNYASAIVAKIGLDEDASALVTAEYTGAVTPGAGLIGEAMAATNLTGGSDGAVFQVLEQNSADILAAVEAIEDSADDIEAAVEGTLDTALVDRTTSEILVDSALALNNGSETNGEWFPAAGYSELKGLLSITGTGNITVYADWSNDQATAYRVCGPTGRVVLVDTEAISSSAPKIGIAIPVAGYVRLVYLASAATMTATLNVQAQV